MPVRPGLRWQPWSEHLRFHGSAQGGIPDGPRLPADFEIGAVGKREFRCHLAGADRGVLRRGKHEQERNICHVGASI